MNARNLLQCLILTAALAGADTLLAHGSVTAEDDICVIRIGFYTAHFKIFQPEASRNREYCEDLPAAGESIFVMEYLHEALGEVPIEFRIIRNTTGLGRFTRLEDVQAMTDLDALTVFHREPGIEKDVYTINHAFAEEGDFLGVVTARHPETDERYMAVFPFHVGGINWGWLPWIAGLALLAQLGYWMSNGTLKRWYSKLAVPVLLLALAGPDPLQAQEPVESDAGHFRVSVQSEVSPVPLNRIHGWVIHLETADGAIVENARLSVDGGMPAHDHGLPTAPMVTGYLGDGNYRVEGLRFHMMGEWELVLRIEHEGVEDEATIPFTL